MTVYLIYGSATDTPWVDEVMLRIVESEELVQSWLKAFNSGGYWKNLRYESWKVTSCQPAEPKS